MPKVSFSKIKKIFGPTFDGRAEKPRAGDQPGQTQVSPGSVAVSSYAQDANPDDVLHVIRQPKKAAVIITPFAAEDYSKAAAVKRYGDRCIKDSVQRGESPVASHLFYYDVLNVKNPIERDIGLLSQLTWIPKCDIVVVYVDFGITPAMRVAINVAQLKSKKLEFRTIGSVS